MPELFDLDYPAMLGVVQNQDAYAQGVAAQRPFYFDHIQDLTDQAFTEYADLTGRRYDRVMGYRLDDADWVLVGMGTVVPNAEAVADHLRRTRGLKVGVLNVTMFRPFPSDLVASLLAGKKGVTVLERVDQPLAADPPLLREIRTAIARAWRTGGPPSGPRGTPSLHPGCPRRRGAAALPGATRPDARTTSRTSMPPASAFGSRDLQPGDLIAAVDNMLDEGEGIAGTTTWGSSSSGRARACPSSRSGRNSSRTRIRTSPTGPWSRPASSICCPKDAVSLRMHSVGGWGAITMGKNVALTAFELFGMHVKANPKYGSEKKGQPTTFYAVLATSPCAPMRSSST
jgi:pyruvate-ferredoxin/flavodoxin oxidoreductase